MLTRTRLLVGLAVALALVLTFLKIPLASSQGLAVVAAPVPDELPLTDPDSPLWQEATAIEVPLSAQMVTKPYFPDTKVKSVTARALYNDAQIAFLIEWRDETRNDQTFRVQDFRDSVALQFSLDESQPYFCMGQDGGNVNIWHWKADWQADIIAAGQEQDRTMQTAYPNMYVDYYDPFAEASEQASTASSVDVNYLTAQAAGNLYASPVRISSVEDIVAGGFSTLTAQAADAQNVQGYGVWADGKWRVIFGRELISAEADDVSFPSDKIASVAFAAWDGSNNERNGTKSTSQWVSLQLGKATSEQGAESTVATAETSFPVASVLFWGGMALLLLMILIGGLIYARLPE